MLSSNTKSKDRPITEVMGRHYVEEHVVNELRKCSSKEEEPNEAEGMLLSCLYQELLRKVLQIAKSQASSDGSREVQPYHIESALEIVMEG